MRSAGPSSTATEWRARCATASPIGPSQTKQRSLFPGRTGSTAFGGAALTHGFQVAFYVLAAIAGVAALASALMLESRPPAPDAELVEPELGRLATVEEAA